MSTILKRFEIWVLLALVVGSVWWAFQTDPIEDIVIEGSDPSEVQVIAEVSKSADSGFLEVKEVNLTTMSEGSVVELTLFGHSGTDDPVTLGEENLELLTSEGEDVHRFFLPFDAAPMLSSSEKSLVTLKYWLKKPADVLWLTYRDQTVKVEIPGVSI